MNTLSANRHPATPGEDVIRASLTSSRSIKWPDPEPLTQAVNKPADYPIDALPAIIRDAAEEVARFVKVPVVSPAVVGVSVVATALGKCMKIEELQGLSHYPTLFHLIVAASGERKSHVFKHMQVPLTEWEKEREAAWKKECDRVETRAATSRKMISVLEKQITLEMSNAERNDIEQRIAEERASINGLPPAPRLSTSNATEERLFQLMHEHGGAFAVLSGEGRPVLDVILGRYSDGRMGDAIYLAGISGDDITRDRVGNDRTGPESRVIRTPTLNVCIMVQPDKLLEVVRHPSLRASGWLARIWSVWLPSLVGTRLEEPNEAGLNQARFVAFHALVRHILDQRARHEDKPPHVARLSPRAAEARRLYHNDIEQRMAVGKDFEDVRDIASKAVSATVKMAGILHVMEHPDVFANEHSEISLDTWEAAQLIGAYHLDEAIRIQRLAAEDEGLSEATRAAAWLAHKWDKPEITASELRQEMGRPRPKNAAEARSILQTPVEYGYLATRPTGDVLLLRR